jgi:putative ABC transport system permease protein
LSLKKEGYNESESNSSAPVIVLGFDIAKSFGESEPIGKTFVFTGSVSQLLEC